MICKLKEGFSDDVLFVHHHVLTSQIIRGRRVSLSCWRHVMLDFIGILRVLHLSL